MVALPSRHRSLFLLTVVVVVQVLALAFQIQRGGQDGESHSLIRAWTVGAISPFERGGAWGFGKIRAAWNHYFALGDTARWNEELRRENDALKVELSQLQSKAAEADRLAALLQFRQLQAKVPMIGARVIHASADANSAVIYLDRGTTSGIKKNMGVITADGVVGKVIESYSDAAQVLLLTDKDSGVGAMLGDSRIQSPVGGTGEPLLVMKYISNDDEVKVGERVVTSGMDRIFPKDLPVGVVADVKSNYPFKLVRVRPAANLERLEEVIVLLTTDPLVLKKDPEPADASDTKTPAATGSVTGTASPTTAPAQKSDSKPKSPAKPAPSGQTQ